MSREKENRSARNSTKPYMWWRSLFLYSLRKRCDKPNPYQASVLPCACPLLSSFPQHDPSKPCACGRRLQTQSFISRSESPGTPRRRSSAFQGSGSRQSSFVDRPRGNSRQWDSPRGSLAGITSSGYGQSPAGYSPASSGYGQASPNYGQNSSGYGQTSSGYGQSSPAYSTPRGSLTGASGTLPRSRSPSAPHTSFRTPSHSPATNSRSFELGPSTSRDGSKVFNGRNGPSPLLKDGAQPQSSYDTLPVGRNTLTQKVNSLLDTGSVAFSFSHKTCAQVSTEELLLPTRSDSSCSLTLESGSKLSDKDVFTSRRQKSGDALTICDSGSEVSDEGYKSSQGNVSKTEEANAHNVPTDSLAKCNENQGE